MKKILSLCLFLCGCLSASAAMHIHTDAADYRAGGRIWFRVHEQSPADEVLFAELLDPHGLVTKRIKLLRWDDIFSGYMDIPTSCAAGRYLLRAYTRSSIADGGEDTRQIIYIHGRLVDSSAVEDSMAVPHLTEEREMLDRAVMPLSSTKEKDRLLLHLDTTFLLPGEQVFLSVSVTDRYAISRHPQWTILHSLSPLLPSLQGGAGVGFTNHPSSMSSLHGMVVTPLRGRPVVGAVVNMIVPGTYFCASDTTDADGAFAFEDELVPEGMPVLLTAFSPSGRDNVTIRIEEDTFPAYRGIEPRLIRIESRTEAMALELNDITDSVLLEEIEVLARASHESQLEQHAARLADFSFGLSKIQELDATCLHDLLRRVPGVWVHNDQCYIRGAHSIYGNNPAAIAINGVIQDGDYDLDLLPMQDIARVDVFKSGTTVIWGPRGGAGVISIILKDGTEIPRQSEKNNLRSCRPLGWQLPQTFSPEPPMNGRRTPTVFWTPNLRAATVPLPHPALQTVYDVHVEGTTSKGRVVCETIEIFL